MDARGLKSWSEFLLVAGVVCTATLVSLALRAHLAPVNLEMVYLVGVVAVAARSSRRAAVAASLLSVASFDFFCVPPYLTFVVDDVQYVFTFAGMLAVAAPLNAPTGRGPALARGPTTP